MTSSMLGIDRKRLGELCRRYRVARLEVVGSFATGDAGPGSNLDILVSFEPGARIGLEFIALKKELERVIGRPVDLFARSSVERSANKYLRHYMLRHTEPL